MLGSEQRREAAMEAPADNVVRDAVRQQVDLLSQWSRFYHDAEIKVNSGSLVISVLAAIGDKYVGVAGVRQVFGHSFNVTGILIALVSLAALVSTLGYWRYYEMCDFLGKKYRNLNLPSDLRKAVHKEFEEQFKKTYPILGRVHEDAHHIVWLFAQFTLFIVGLVVAFNVTGNQPE